MEASVEIQEPKAQARPTELIDLLNLYANKIKVLSLDCFDTLLWRKTATPMDVFYDMQSKPTFNALGFSANLRISAESKARRYRIATDNSSEVKLHDIYSTNYPNINQQQIKDLIEDEITSELSACYAFPPVIELIRHAHKLGLNIIIVSDTYLEESQLRRLLEYHLPEDVMQAITKIFVSNEYGLSKSQGLFSEVIKKINISAQTILHIGDDFNADYVGPRKQNVNTVQLIYNEDIIAELTRMQALAASLFDTSIRHSRSLSNPFRGLFATSMIKKDEAERVIGYAAVGPIMYAFAKYICNEVEKIQALGKKPKVLFLMRDAYLPSLICEAIAGKSIGHRVRISRFASYASSFRSKQDVDRYLVDVVASKRFNDICRQLLLPEKVATPLIQQAEKYANSPYQFMQLVHQDHILKIIFEKSSAYRKRLKRHLENEVGLEKGDTLIFVDLGYTGTTQLLLENVFRDELNVEIIGRYLIQLRIPEWEKSRAGLLDPSCYDDRTLLSLVAYIALLEQICTSNDKSVVDYDDKGNPIYSDTTVNIQQHNKLKDIQSECVRFATELEIFSQNTKLNLDEKILRDVALTNLVRLLYLPTQIELDYLQSFQFDLNLGTADLLKVFDQSEGLTGLRRRGMFFMEKNLKSMRTNYPAELRSAGLELAITLLAQHRFDFDVRVKDLSLRRETIQLIVMRSSQASQIEIEAIPTHDGYFSLLIPIGSGNFQIGVLFGMNYQYLQLESADVIKTAALFGSKESNHTFDATSQLSADQMSDKGGGLFECQSEAAILIFNPTMQLDEHNHVLRLVFRPVVMRKKKLGNENKYE